MDLKSKVFLQLYRANGNFVSGEALASVCDVTRAAVWKAVKALKEEGYEIESVTNRGYTLLPTKKQVDARAVELLTGIKTLFFDRLPSTNAYALTSAAPLPFLVIAKEQTEGKARHEEKFLSPDGGVYFSYAFAPDLPITELPALTYRIAEQIAELLGGRALENEVFLPNGKKAAGVLTEMIADFDNVKKAVIGIGLLQDGLQEKDKTEIVVDLITRIQKL